MILKIQHRINSNNSNNIFTNKNKQEKFNTYGLKADTVTFERKPAQIFSTFEDIAQNILGDKFKKNALIVKANNNFLYISNEISHNSSVSHNFKDLLKANPKLKNKFLGKDSEGFISNLMWNARGKNVQGFKIETLDEDWVAISKKLPNLKIQGGNGTNPVYGTLAVNLNDNSSQFILGEKAISSDDFFKVQEQVVQSLINSKKIK